MGGAGATNIVSGGTLTISGLVSLDTRTLNNSGTVVRTSNLTIYFYNSSVINNQSGGVFDIRNDPTFSVQSGSPAFNNSGLFKKSGGTGTSSFNLPFNNTGAIEVDSGIISFANAAGLTTGTTNIAIGGTTAGSGYGQIQKNGSVTFGGPLNVSLTNGFMPSGGNSFTVMTYGGYSGSFSPISLPTLSTGRFWNSPQYNGTSLVLSVNSCPTITLSSLPTSTAGVVYSQAISANGGTPSYSFAVSSGSLPAGMSLWSDGTFTGTPAYAGTYAFTVTATDANSCIGSQAYSFTVANTSCVAPQSGLVSWWQGEGNANDQMSANHGTLMSGATTTAIGKVGQAFFFDGVNDSMSVGMLGNTALNETLPFTISAWINPSTTTGYQVIAGNYMGEAGGSGDYSTTLYIYNGLLYFSLNQRQVITNDVVAAATTGWQFVTATYDGTNLSLYMNGQSVGSAVRTFSGATDNTRGWYVGSYSPQTIAVVGYTTTFNGLLDEVQIYNRALSATEVADSYNAGSNGLCDTISPTVKSTSPANSATNVDVASAITITFSEALGPATVDATTLILSGSTGSIAYDPISSTATFTPSANLAYGTLYTAMVTTGVRDAAGNALASAYTWTFTTAAVPLRTITATAGAGGSITPSGAVSVNLGSDQQFAVAPQTEHLLVGRARRRTASWSTTAARRMR